MQAKKRNFEVKDGDKTYKLSVVTPNTVQQNEALKKSNRAFADAVNSGAILRSKAEHVSKMQGLWDEDKQKEFETLRDKLNEQIKQLDSGGIELNEAYKLALQIKRNRLSLRNMQATLNSLDQYTCESQAENAKLNYLASQCIVDGDTGKPFFKSYDDYLSNDTHPVALRGGLEFGLLYYGADPEDEKKLPENKFLKEYKFADDEGRLINKDGKYVDLEGRLIDKDYNYINENNEKVDINGNRLNDDGSYLVNKKPFLKDGVVLDDPPPSPSPTKIEEKQQN